MQITLDGKLEFYPSYQDLLDVILNTGKAIATSLSTIPSAEVHLIAMQQTQYLKTALPDHVAAPYYKQLEEIINELFAGPQAELEDLIAKYGHLIDGTDEAQNEKYSGDTFTFEEAVEDIKKYKETISEVNQVSVTKNFPIVILNYEDAKRGLITAARNHAERIVNALLARHRKDCDSIISEFEEIKGVAEKNPENTEELIKIQNYIIEIKGKRLQQIDLELEAMLKRMMYLLDVHLFSLVLK